MRRLRRYLLPVLWLSVSLGATALVAITFIGLEALQKPAFDIQLHNTYFVFSRTSFIGLLFVPIALVVGIVIILFQRRSITGHLLLAGFSALVSYVASNVATLLEPSGQTIYPPLDPETAMPNPLSSFYQAMLLGAYVLQLLALLFFGYNCYRAGKLSAASKLENAGGA